MMIHSKKLRLLGLRNPKSHLRNSIKPWDGSGIKFPVGTKVMFKSDAKKPYGLTEKEILSLPFNGFANSSKRIYSVEQLEKLAEKKFEALGIEYPALMFPPNFMIKTSEHLTGLLGRPDNLFARIRRNKYL
ncbi:hypothetical protein C8Q75DRAFT_779096 [Abortiporus biennis]|nr:hypothetical protein C8Q75DRAFT_779096 [Abortiporus biennis]